MAQRPHDPLVRQMFNRIKREYKEALKRARQEFRSQLTESLENFSNENPKMYWKILDQLKNIDEVGGSEGDPIPGDIWCDHYKKLLRSHTVLEADNEVLHELNILERDAIFNELSYHISQREVNDALTDLK